MINADIICFKKDGTRVFWHAIAIRKKNRVGGRILHKCLTTLKGHRHSPLCAPDLCARPWAQKGTVSLTVGHYENMIHRSPIDLNGFAHFSFWSMPASREVASPSTRGETAASLLPFLHCWKGEPAFIITPLAAMRRLTGKAKEETLIELQSASDSQMTGHYTHLSSLLLVYFRSSL